MKYRKQRFKKEGGNNKMTTSLDEKIQQANIERQRKYPLLDISDNRAEIREIAQKTQDYIVELNPEVRRPHIWESIPRIVIEFITKAFESLKDKSVIELGEVTLTLGDITTLGVNYTTTSDADKFGNITPFCICRSEWKYENASLPYQDAVPSDIAKILEEEDCVGLPIQFYENREQIKEISVAAFKTLHTNYGIKFSADVDDTRTWWLIPLIVLAFMRKAKEFLIEHKDDGEIGVTINFADLISFGIRKEGGMDEDDPIDYILFIEPGQIFKKENAKSDGDTEQV